MENLECNYSSGSITLEPALEPAFECTYPRCLVDEARSICHIRNEHIGDETNIKFNVDATLSCIDFPATNMSSFPNQVFETFPNQLFETFPDLLRVTLDSNGLKVWKRSFLKDANCLTHLGIYRNPISYFESSSFSRASNLKELNITESEIKAINPNMFQSLPNLVSLTLTNHNFSQNLLDDVFDNLSHSLQSLNLCNSKLSKIPAGIKNLKKLEVIFLSNNNFKAINTIQFPISLRELHL